MIADVVALLIVSAGGILYVLDPLAGFLYLMMVLSVCRRIEEL
jgi:hypothetical protein